MKIGILTYQYAMNYGALLQAYALKTYLDNAGYDVEILNYDTSYLYARHRSVNARIKSSAWSIVKSLLGARKKKKNFDIFRNEYLKLNDNSISSKDELIKYISDKSFDAFIVGSDQVWNPEINGFDDTYYLNFTDSALKVSYAASFGVASLNEADLDTILENLKTFSAISVREKTGLEILKAINQRIDVVLDPVFLPDISTWDRLAGSEPCVKGEYMLCYVMPGDTELENKIEDIALQYKKVTGNQVIFLGRKEYKKLKKDGKDMVSASPGEFVNLFKNAGIVITNSFHGTAFSIIYNKKFYSLVNRRLKGNKQLGSRVIDLLSELDIPERAIDSDGEYNFNCQIEFNNVNERLIELKNSSKEFLNKALHVL